MIEIISETGEFTSGYYFPEAQFFNERTKDGHYLYTTSDTENVTVGEIEELLIRYFHAGFISEFNDSGLKLKIILNDGDL